MKFYNDTLHYGESFAERIGDPEEIDAAIGRVIESFSFLEESLANIITILLDVDNEVGEIVTSELSFKGLLNLFSSLFKYKYDRGDFVVEDEDPEERLKELLKLCYRAEEERNKIVHSSYVARRYRVKKTAKARSGLKTIIENLDASRMLDISDFIGTVGMHVQEFPVLGLNIATRISGGPLIVQYYYEGELIAAFGHEELDET